MHAPGSKEPEDISTSFKHEETGKKSSGQWLDIDNCRFLELLHSPINIPCFALEIQQKIYRDDTVNSRPRRDWSHSKKTWCHGEFMLTWTGAHGPYRRVHLLFFEKIVHLFFLKSLSFSLFFCQIFSSRIISKTRKTCRRTKGNLLALLQESPQVFGIARLSEVRTIQISHKKKSNVMGGTS